MPSKVSESEDDDGAISPSSGARAETGTPTDSGSESGSSIGGGRPPGMRGGISDPGLDPLLDRNAKLDLITEEEAPLPQRGFIGRMLGIRPAPAVPVQGTTSKQSEQEGKRTPRGGSPSHKN